MSLDYYNAQEKHWLSPRLVLVYYDDLIKKIGIDAVKNNRKYRKAIEARSAALNLLGMQKHDPKNFLMQVPKDIHHSPDVVTMFREEVSDKPVQLRIQDVEVVDYEADETRRMFDFLMEEKLSPSLARKAYDEKTIVLCHIKKPGRFNHELLHRELKEFSPKPHVLLLGKVNDDRYETTQVWPTFGSIQYSVMEEINKYPKPDSLLLTLGTNKKIVTKETGLSLPSLEEVFEITH